MMDKVITKKEMISVAILLLVAVFFSTYQLKESPVVWYDEGIIIQTSERILSTLEHSVQIAPGERIDADFISTGFPLTIPLGITFNLFGKSILSARSLMAVFIILFLTFTYLYMRQMFSVKIAIYSLAVIVGLATLYGNGKTALGEVPGLFYLVGSLYFARRLELNKYKSRFLFIVTALFVGLAISTKPVFLVFLPAILLGVFIKRKDINFRSSGIFYGICVFLLVFLFWLKTQFSESNTLSTVLGDYTNPQLVNNLYQTLIENTKALFTELTPFYFLIIFCIWLIAFILRFIKKQNFSITEISAFVFSVLVFSAYFRGSGWYRDFFTALVLSLIFLVPSLERLLISLKENRIFSRLNIQKSLFIIVAFVSSVHIYQTGANSWVAEGYVSNETRNWEDYFDSYDWSESIFLYNTPEVGPFLNGDNYYQYMDINDRFQPGIDKIPLISEGVPDRVLIGNNLYRNIIPDNFPLYEEVDWVNIYTILKRK